ncbi:MAG: transcriptional repressor [Lysobacterales bacterium]
MKTVGVEPPRPAHVDAHRHSHAPARFVRAVEKVCSERGLRLTTVRRRVLELIAAEAKPVKAYDLLDSLRSERAGKVNGRGAAPPTIYRALDFLLEHRFIHRLASINAYTGCHHPEHAHAVPFFICDSCDSAIELCDDGVADLLEAQAATLGFRAESQSLEVHGQCAQCQRA